MDEQQKKAFIGRLEQMGEESVRAKFKAGTIGAPPDKQQCVIEWLGEKELEKRQTEEERENRKIQLTEDANKIASKAVVTARIALVVSGIGVLIALVALFFK